MVYGTQNDSRWLQFFHQVSEKVHFSMFFTGLGTILADVRLDINCFYRQEFRHTSMLHIDHWINISEDCLKVGDAYCPIVIPMTIDQLDQFDLFWTQKSYSEQLFFSSMLEQRSVPEELAGPSLQEAAEQSVQADILRVEPLHQV